MGRCRNLGRNVAKYNVKMSRKKTDKIFKKKGKSEVVVDETMNAAIVESITESQQPKEEIPVAEMDEAEKTGDEPKKVPIVREGRLRRDDLPLYVQDSKKGNERTDKVKPKKTKTSCVAVRKMSKKKARKIIGAQQREQRRSQRIASAMEQ